MFHRPSRVTVFLTIAIVQALCVTYGSASAETTFPVALRSGLVAHLQVEGDSLEIGVTKKDLNIYDGPDVLLVRLMSPEGRVMAQADIPDDGVTVRRNKRRTTQSSRISLDHIEPGRYRLVIRPEGTADLIFGFETDAKGVMVESPKMLLDARRDLSGAIYFAPPKKETEVAAQGRGKKVHMDLPVVDGAGKQRALMELRDGKKTVKAALPKSVTETAAPWRMDIPKWSVMLTFGDTLWTASKDAVFDFPRIEQTIAPYYLRAFLEPGAERLATLEVRNRIGRAATLTLATRSDNPKVTCEIVEPTGEVALPFEVTGSRFPDCPVRVRLAASPDLKPGDKARCVVTATYKDEPELQRATTIDVTIGEDRLSLPLELPLTLKPYEHENAQYAYLPDYPLNPPFFASGNVPFIRMSSRNRDRMDGIATLEDGKWVVRPIEAALKAAFPDFVRTHRSAGKDGAKIVFDRNGHGYTIVKIVTERGFRLALLDSPDGFRTVNATELPWAPTKEEWKDLYVVWGGYSTTWEMEQWTGGFNTPDGPPAILLEHLRELHPARYANRMELVLLLPKLRDGKIDLGEPIRITGDALSFCRHSGAPNWTATRDGKTHVVWGGITDDKDAPGVPIWIRTVDHKTRKMTEPMLLTYGAPPNDSHNAPAIVQDSKGCLHVVSGAHQQPFQYTRSLKPNDISGGWTKPIHVWDSGRFEDPTSDKGRACQTYVAMLCDRNDTLHITYRQYRQGIDRLFDGAGHAELVYQRKTKDAQTWSRPTRLIAPAFPGYSVYYHKMSMDVAGRIYLKYSYYTQGKLYMNYLPGKDVHPAMIMSKDGGDTWKLVTTQDFIAGLAGVVRGPDGWIGRR